MTREAGRSTSTRGRDPVLGIERLQEAYIARIPGYDRGITVPAIVDIPTGQVVTNDYCTCREPRPCHATRRYSLIMPSTRVSLRRRYWSRSTGSGSGFSGAAASRERWGGADCGGSRTRAGSAGDG